MAVFQLVKMTQEVYEAVKTTNDKVAQKLKGIAATPNDTSDDEPKTEQRQGTESRSEA